MMALQPKKVRSRYLQKCTLCWNILEELSDKVVAVNFPEEIVRIFSEDIGNNSIFRLCNSCVSLIFNLFVYNIDKDNLPLYINYNEFKNIGTMIIHSIEIETNLKNKILILGTPVAGNDLVYLNNKIRELVINRLRKDI